MDRQPLTAPQASPPWPEAAFTARVRERFGRRAAAYRQHAQLQRAVAWRLAHLLLRRLDEAPLPPGPAADLGAGSGLLSEAFHQQGLRRPLVQLDLCPQLLAANPVAQRHGQRLWNLNHGLPSELGGASLLCSSFVLQWLDHPEAQLELWCNTLAPGGWLALALPTAASFPQWHRAAHRAGVQFSGLALPASEALQAVAQQYLDLHHLQRLCFSKADCDGRHFFRSLRAIGAVGSRQPRHDPAELRRLLQHWPKDEGITWTLLLLIGRRAS